ncbi:thiamine pyrophosphate-binding protein [Marimonas arenosa]|uniref:Thiamine pyrophosphate-binding protein n=1 Tax=Marimonas arenosa TaxID=1795305 RepID=A0AAE3WBM1_9RHOB|nr:thiamine pyrophosphate-binding protein [Marimonas arenosa]MDQ2090226.1 thiamine pyrophosphate-binding protein [Marimonas arenosa]
MASHAEIIAGHLAKAGCRHAFGMPGGEVLVLLEALRAAGIAFHLVKHENAGGFMAEGSWHATGAPGLLLTTVGPGLANAVNSVANAFQEQVPLIVLSGCIDPGEAAQFTHQVIDQQALMAPVTKASIRVAPGTAAQAVQKALSIATSDPMGPVHLDLPVGIAGAEAPDLALALAPVRAGWADAASLERAADMLQGAEQPVILAGMGAVQHCAGAAIARLARDNGIPVLTTYKAKGVIDEADPLCLGGHGLSPLSDGHVLPLLAASDCVILAGYDPIEMRAGWIRPFAAEAAIDLCHARIEHGMHGAAIRVVGDVAQMIEALHGALDVPLQEVWPGGEPATARAALKAVFADRGDWGVHAVFATLQQGLPEGAVVTVDSGAHRILMSQMWQCAQPGALLQSTAFCTMGVAVPLAAGVAAASDAPVVAVVGDAGFDMTAGELATLRDLGRQLTVVVLADDSLALIEKKQSAMQLPGHGVDFAPTDIAAVARAYGGIGIDVANREAFAAALADSWKNERFSIISCKVDKKDYVGAF